MGIKEKPVEAKGFFIDTDVTEPIKAYFNRTTVTNFEELSEIVDTANRRIYLGEIEEVTGDAVNAIIRFYNSIDKYYGVSVEDRIPIKIYINSDGGDLLSCFTIIDSIQLSETPVWTINTGKAYSAGLFIYVCGDKRLAYPSSSFLFHEGSIVAGGDAHKFQNQADFYKRQRELLKQLILDHSKITEELYNEHAKDDWWMMPDEGMELGFVDIILKKGYPKDI